MVVILTAIGLVAIALGVLLRNLIHLLSND